MDDKNRRPSSSVDATFALLPSTLLQDRLRALAEADQPTYPPPGRSCWPAMESPVPGLAVVCVRRTGPLHYPVTAAYLCDGRILDVEDGPHSRWTMKTTTTPPCRHRPRAGGEDDVLLQSMDESGWGPRTAAAEAVASPLGVQPTINSAGVSSSMGQSLRMMQLYKLCPLPSATAVFRRRTKTMP
jgi:hypothetical protein